MSEVPLYLLYTYYTYAHNEILFFIRAHSEGRLTMKQRTGGTRGGHGVRDARLPLPPLHVLHKRLERDPLLHIRILLVQIRIQRR